MSIKPYLRRHITLGETFHFQRNYELLNELEGSDYRAWMKSTYHLSDEEFIWMIAIDGKERNGWINSWQGEKIIERYVGGRPEPSNLYEGFNDKHRLVFEKCNNGHERYFVFRGIFQIEAGSSPTNRVLHIISKECSSFLLFSR